MIAISVKNTCMFCLMVSQHKNGDEVCVPFNRSPLSFEIHVRVQRGAGEPDPPPLKNHKNIEFLSATGLDPLKNHKTTEPAFNVRPSLARQRNAI